MKKRVAILVGVPTPYREPLFERLAACGRYEALVLYCRERQPGQDWSLGPPAYPALYLKNYAPCSWHGRLAIGAINPGVGQELAAFRPDAVIVYGYNTTTTLLAILWATSHRVPVIMRGDSNLLNEEGKPPLVLAVKRLFLRWLTHRVSGFLSVGTSNSQYWLRYGAEAEKIFLARYAVNNEYFQSQATHYRACRRQIRDQNGWRQRYLLLYVGRLVPVKGVDVLIDAFRRISATRPDIGLLIVGEGPERKSLEKRAQNLPQVFFLGFRDWNHLPRFYAAADLLVLPSVCEPWGLVVNEAMASGLPVLATRKVGAAQDLIIEGQSGYLVPENHAEALASAIDRACQSEERLRAMGERAQQLIESWNYGATLDGFYQALASCVECRRQ
jgi:glycosyltransferase involved in cell wall biosynthesis